MATLVRPAAAGLAAAAAKLAALAAIPVRIAHRVAEGGGVCGRGRRLRRLAGGPAGPGGRRAGIAEVLVRPGAPNTAPPRSGGGRRGGPCALLVGGRSGAALPGAGRR